MYAPSAREFNIITHEPVLHRLERAQSSSAFRINSKPGASVPQSRPQTSQNQPLDAAGMPKATKLNRNKSNLESYHLYPEPKENIKLFDRQIMTKTFWNEKKTQEEDSKTLFNSPSVNYDFINQVKYKGQNDLPHLRTRAKVAYRKKAIAEFYDLSSVYGPKYNQDYRALLVKDSQCFHNIKGPFSNFLDVAHKSGQLSKPFTKFKCL